MIIDKSRRRFAKLFLMCHDIRRAARLSSTNPTRMAMEMEDTKSKLYRYIRECIDYSRTANKFYTTDSVKAIVMGILLRSEDNKDKMSAARILLQLKDGEKPKKTDLKDLIDSIPMREEINA